MEIARVLTIAGSDSGGGAGIQADLKTITVLGGFGMSVITALTAQNTLGVHGIHEVPVDFIAAQFDAVATDIGIDAAKIGMLASSEIIAAVAAKVRQYGIERLVLDPVMVAKGGASLIQHDAVRSLAQELLPLALVITPNIPEAEVLSGLRIACDEDVRRAARALHEQGARNVYIKGGHRQGDAVDVLFDGREFHEFRCERFDTADTHGTGCTFSAALATGLARGLSLLEACRQAKEYITTAIRFSLRLGGGHGPTNHAAALLRDSARYGCIQELKQALVKLAALPLGALIPEVQSNLDYALPYACERDEVAAFPGSLVRVGEALESRHDPEFGASSHVARVILAAMRHDPDCRSAMVLRFSEPIVRACEQEGLAVAAFDRTDEPAEVNDYKGASLECGMERAIAGRARVPDIVYDRGECGQEPVVRVLGPTPAAVVEKVACIWKRLNQPVA